MPEQFMKKVIEKNPGEVEFHQAVKEVVTSVMPFIKSNPMGGRQWGSAGKQRVSH